MTKSELHTIVSESLRDWFKKEKWVRISSSGKISGPCGTSKNKKNPDRCLPQAKAYSLSKGERAATAAKKKKAGKKGKTVVKNTKKATVKETREEKVTKEDIQNLVAGLLHEMLNEDSLMEEDDRCTKIAKRKYDTWPSAYASGAVVRCRRGDIWKNENTVVENESETIASALKDAMEDLGDEIKQNSDDLVKGDENLDEAAITLAVGLVLSGPEIVSIVGNITKKLSKLLGGKGVSGDKIVGVADKLHHVLLALIEKPLNLIPGVKKSGKGHTLANGILNLVVGGLLVQGGIAMGAKFAARKFSAAGLKAAMNAVKTKEITAYLKNLVKGGDAHESYKESTSGIKNEDNKHKAMNPGILSRDPDLKGKDGKIKISKVRAKLSSTKDKGSTKAKAMQRFINYHD